MSPLLTVPNREKSYSLEELHPYQLDAVEFIKRTPACALWFRMGGGKTVSVLTALWDLYNDFAIHKVLVIAPLRVAKDVWPNEIKKWQHLEGLTCTVLHGPNKEKLLKEDTPIHIINREMVTWLVDKVKQDWPYDTVVIDESSSFKSPRAKRFKSLKKVHLSIDRVIQMTGTPASNSLIDLWSQVYLLDRGQRLGRTFMGFRDRYFYGDYMGYNWAPRERSKEDIYEQLSDICITIADDQAPRVEEPIHNFIELEPPVDAYLDYLSLERNFLLELESEDIEAVNAAVLSGKLLQFCNGALYREDKNWVGVHDEKVNALEELIEGAVGEPFYYQRMAELAEGVAISGELKFEQEIEPFVVPRAPVVREAEEAQSVAPAPPATREVQEQAPSPVGKPPQFQITDFNPRSGGKPFAPVVVESINASAARHNIDPRILAAMVAQESDGYPLAVKAGENAVGLLQIRPQAAKDAGIKLIDRTDPAKNIEAGAKFFNKNLEKIQKLGVTGDDALALTIIAHNTGPIVMAKAIRETNRAGEKLIANNIKKRLPDTRRRYGKSVGDFIAVLRRGRVVR